MSAELLRRAAEKLRERANGLPEPWRSNRWRVVQTDTEYVDGIAACDSDHEDDPHGAFDCCWSTDTLGSNRVAEYVRLMHPPVALALAGWLEAAAEVVEANYAHDGFDLDAIDDTYRGAVTTARAILRENGGTP